MVSKSSRSSCSPLAALGALALASLLAVPGLAQIPLAVDSTADSTVDSAIAPPDKRLAKPAPALKSDPFEAEPPLRIVLDEASAAEKSALAPEGKGPLKIGFPRPLPEHFRGDLTPLLSFDRLADHSRAAVFTVTSPGARALRLALSAEALPPGAELRVFGLQGDRRVYGPYGGEQLVRGGNGQGGIARLGDDLQGIAKREEHAEPFWTPVVEGDEVGVEIVLPAVADPRGGFNFAVEQVSHLELSVHDLGNKRLSDIGDSGSCNIDVACRTSENRHTAKIVFTQSGSTYLCTGTLMNDNDDDSWIPYLLTANHCVSNQGVAYTVNTYWSFERATCGGPNPTTVNQETGGAELLANGSTNDFSLLQLNDQTGSLFAGWDTSTVGANTSVVGIHHPSGDLKKWSSGTVTGASAYWSDTHNSSANFWRVLWSQGTTEGGSSGSGLFDGAGRLRGTLTGGKASCSSSNKPDWYGRFDQAFGSMRQWLLDGATPLTSGANRRDTVSSYSWNEYKITAPWYATQIKAEIYGLGADVDLYVRSGSRATFSSYDCRPFYWGPASETCTLSTSGNTTWYIGVRGYQYATSYSLLVTAY